jgi:hypothetical protein
MLKAIDTQDKNDPFYCYYEVILNTIINASVNESIH